MEKKINNTDEVMDIKSEMEEYVKTHADFKKYYDITLKRNIWILGYFGGGSVAICEAYELAKMYAESNRVPLETVKIDEILKSSRFKSFKFIFSGVNQEKENGAEEMEHVYNWICA